MILRNALVLLSLILSLFIRNHIVFVLAAVQNERDRISCRRPSYDEATNNSGISLTALLNAEMYSRQVVLILFYFLNYFNALFYIIVLLEFRLLDDIS